MKIKSAPFKLRCAIDCWTHPDFRDVKENKNEIFETMKYSLNH